MSDFIENQIQLLLAGQALENDICDPHVPADDTTGMSDTSADNNCCNDLAKASNLLLVKKKMKDRVQLK